MNPLARAVLAESVSLVWKPKASVTFDAGFAVEGAASQPVVILGSVHPVSAKVLTAMAEGDRVDARYTVYTLEAVQVDDTVTHAGADHRVMQSEHRPKGGFYKLVIG